MKTRKTIEDILNKNPQGLTIQEIADKTELNRNTVMVHLARMEGEGLVQIRQVGNAKLHYLRRK